MEWSEYWIKYIKVLYHVNQMRLKSIDNNSSFSFYQVRLENLVNCMEKQI